MGPSPEELAFKAETRLAKRNGDSRTMADRTLPLAERVNAAYLAGIQVADGDENGRDARAALDALRADVAAAERLAEAADCYHRGLDLAAPLIEALAAYRARKEAS